MAVAGAIRTTERAWVLPRREQRPDWTLPDARKVGAIRTACTRMEGTAFSAGVVLILMGQTAPLHANSGEQVMFQVEGDVAFEIDGHSYPLEPGDMLFLPAHTPYAYRNTGRDTASFISVIGEREGWPPEATYYDGVAAPRDGADSDRPWILKSREQQPAWTLPRAGTVGYVRGWYTRIEATGFGAGIATIEPGQTTPLHSSAAEHAIYLLDGEVEWTVLGERLVLGPGDMLFIPADARYVYANIGRTRATFVSVISRVRDWPHKDTYYE